MLKRFMFKKLSELNRRNLTKFQFGPQTRRLLSLERRLLYRELSKRQKRTGQLPNDNDQIWEFISLVHKNYCCWRWKKNGRQLNIVSPKTLGEKLEWLKLNDHRELYIKLADKISVRDYVVSKTGNSKILNKIYGIYNSTSEIILDELPGEIVIKTNHGSGSKFICYSKDLFNTEMRKKLDKCLTKKFATRSGEWPYWHIQPKIFIEEYLEDQFSQLVDYKVYCFNGQPKIILVCMDRLETTGMKKLFFDTKWELLPITDAKYPPIKVGADFPRPKSLEEMLRYAFLLSQNLAFVRADFYDLDGECRFGELTLYPESGLGCTFNPPKWGLIFGEWLDLPKPNRNPRLAYSKN